jgi:hypothetical protein
VSDEFYGFDDEDFDCCDPAEDEPQDYHGCIFPGKCLMPGEHLVSECATAEMMETIYGGNC